MTLQQLKEMRGHGQLSTLNFNTTAPALSSLCVCSPLLTRPFRVYLIRPHFALNQNRTLKLYFYVSADNDTSTTLPISGTNILQMTSPQTFVSGDDEFKEIFQEYYEPQGNSFFKVLAVNEDSYDHALDCQIFIELY